MAFCQQCGNQLPADAQSCPKCGTPIEGAKNEQSGEKKDQFDFSAKLSELNNTQDTTADYDPADISNNKVMAILSYLWILVLIPLFAAKDSKFARFHVNQGLVLVIAEVAFSIAKNIVVSIITAIIPILGGLLSAVLWIVDIVFLILLVIGIVNAANGKAKELPVIGKITLIK